MFFDNAMGGIHSDVMDELQNACFPCELNEDVGGAG